MDIRMFDVTTGKIVRAPQHDYKGEISGLLGLIKTIARQLAGLESDKPTKKDSDGLPWMWIGLGTLVVGGGLAALFLVGGSDSGGGGGSPLPDPVWPPE